MRDGVWMQFWKAQNAALCFGVKRNASDAVREAFLTHWPGPTKQFEQYILGWFNPDVLAAENVIDQVWAKLEPVLDAVVAASEWEPEEIRRRAAGSSSVTIGVGEFRAVGKREI